MTYEYDLSFCVRCRRGEPDGHEHWCQHGLSLIGCDDCCTTLTDQPLTDQEIAALRARRRHENRP